MLHSFDPVIFGRRIRAARILAGVRDRRTMARQLCRIGVMCSAKEIRSWEEGVVLPSYDEMTGILLVLEPPGGLYWFREAVGPDIRGRLRKLEQG